MTNSTIAAISTPYGKGGIAVIRISGDGTRDVLGGVFSPKGKTAPADSPRTAVFGDIVSADGAVVDTGVAVFYKSPAPSSAQWNVTSILATGSRFFKEKDPVLAEKYLKLVISTWEALYDTTDPKQFPHLYDVRYRNACKRLADVLNEMGRKDEASVYYERSIKFGIKH